MVTMDTDERHMAEALELAERGRGAVEPNPMVGAVIVRGRRRLGSGYHERFGAAHAEIAALQDARRNGRDVRGATLFVSLEPCCTHGKTPPCTEAIIAAGIARVVAALPDPDPAVRGRGIAALRAAGIDVRVGVGEPRARALLGPYIKTRTQRRPWVICKWAQTRDGCLALPGGTGRWVSGEAARREVHGLRARCDGICVGVRTVLADDPLLTNRSGAGRQPTRVVLDARLRTPPDSRLVRTAAEAPVLIATGQDAERAAPERAAALRRAGVELLALPQEGARVQLLALLDELGRRRWTYLLVEGGPRVLESFLSADLADELLVFVAKKKCGPSGEALPRFDIHELARSRTLGEPQRTRIGPDTLLRFVLGRY